MLVIKSFLSYFRNIRCKYEKQNLHYFYMVGNLAWDQTNINLTYKTTVYWSKAHDWNFMWPSTLNDGELQVICAQLKECDMLHKTRTSCR